MASAYPHPRPLPPVLDDACALFLDVDGTLVAFRDHPDLVQVPPDTLAVLDRLGEHLGGALALVSGRPLSDLDRLFFPRRFPAAGLHGQELRDATAPSAHAGTALHALRREAGRMAARHPGMLVEDKGASLALHWRAAPDAADAVMAWARAHLSGLRGYRLQPGDHVVEIMPAGVNKGSALRSLMSLPSFNGRTPVFVGDDLTDEFGFAVANASGGWSVQVGEREPSQAMYRLADPAAVQVWLRDSVLKAAIGARASRAVIGPVS